MDPIELLELCRQGAETGMPEDTLVPRMFSIGDYEECWRRDPKRVREILDGTLVSAHPDRGLEFLLRSGCLEALMPELREMRGLGDDPISSLHKDVWEHTKQVVAGVPALAEMRWSALMHDIGKSRTRRVDARGRVTFHNHDMVGARMVDRIQERLKIFDTSLHLTVRSLVLSHLRPAGYKKDWTDSGVRRLLTDLGGMPGFDRLMALSRADLTTKNPNKRTRALERGQELEERVKAVYADDSSPRLPKGTMGKVLELSGKRPGRWLNELRDELESMMAAGAMSVDRDADFYVNEALKIAQRLC